MKKYNLTLFGVKETTKILAEHLYHQGIMVDLIISIDASVVEKNDVSNYMDLCHTAQLMGADYYCANDYSLKQLDDDFFERHDFERALPVTPV